MLSKSSDTYRGPQAAELLRRLREPRRFIQVLAGPRQVSKTTLVQQVADDLANLLLARITQNEREYRTLAVLRDTLLPKRSSGTVWFKDTGRYLEVTS